MGDFLGVAACIRRRFFFLGRAVLVVTGLGLAGCDVPKDPESTLQSVTGRTLKVGLLVDSADVHAEDTRAIARLGDALSAEVKLQRAAPDSLLAQLEAGDIHLLAGDLPKDTILAKRLGLSKPIGTIVMDGERRDRVLGLRKGENAFLLFIDRTLGGRAFLMPYPDLPDNVHADLAKARRLEGWTIFFLMTIVALMAFVMGTSQAMKSAWAEDLLSFLPPLLFLLATWIERKPPTKLYPFGFHRAGSLAFFASACALLAMGLFLIYEAAHTLMTSEHPTIGSVSMLGVEIWQGWLMIGALTYSVIPPVVLGRMKKPLAKRLRDHVLHTDADMNAADWQTGLAGIAGILGVGFGFWWADAVAAVLISLSILKDGFDNILIAVAELMDGAPRKTDNGEISQKAKALERDLSDRYPASQIQLRQTGRYIRALVTPQDQPLVDPSTAADIASADAWWLIEVSVALDYSQGFPSTETPDPPSDS